MRVRVFGIVVSSGRCATTVADMSPNRPSSRSVSLVVIDDGDVLGETGRFEVATPWWLDVAEISRRWPGIVVLRLLEGQPAPGWTVGGTVTYLVEPLSGASTGIIESLGPLGPWDAPLAEDELRMPWATPGGPEADLAWARTWVSATGEPVQHRTWNLSSIWSIPTTGGDVWLKCVPAFFQHEPAVLGLLANEAVPNVIASDGCRMLLSGLPGADGYEAEVPAHETLIDVLVTIQLGTVGRVEQFLEAGVPDRRWRSLIEAAADVVARRDPANADLRALLDGADERVAMIDACGLPTVLVHGDAHPGNARIGSGAGRGIWFDWGDSRIGNPLIDIAVLDRPGTQHAGRLRSHWLGLWGAACAGSDPERAWMLSRPLAALGDAVVYQGFLDRIEQSERIYHESDVTPCLERAAALLRAE